MKRLVLLVLLSLVLATSGCLDSEQEETPEEMDQPQPEPEPSNENGDDTADEGDQRQVVIEAGEYSFDEDTIEVEEGETVEIVLANTGDMQHSLRILELDQETEMVFPGERDSIEVTFNEEGEYTFECAAHSIMTGTIIVE